MGIHIGAIVKGCSVSGVSSKERSEAYELVGRKIFEQWANSNINIESVRFTDGQFNVCDTIMTCSNGRSVAVEIKYRQYKSTDYSTWFLEAKKLKNLVVYKYKNNIDMVMYCNIFPDGKIVFWNLLDERVANSEDTSVLLDKATVGLDDKIEDKALKLLSFDTACKIEDVSFDENAVMQESIEEVRKAKDIYDILKIKRRNPNRQPKVNYDMSKFI